MEDMMEEIVEVFACCRKHTETIKSGEDTDEMEKSSKNNCSSRLHIEDFFGFVVAASDGG